MSVFAERIRQRRKSLKLTQERLAELLGMTHKDIWEYEKGVRQPRALMVVSLAHALNTTTDWLLGLTDNPERPLRDERDLDNQERELIEIFRSYDHDTKERAVNVLKALE